MSKCLMAINVVKATGDQLTRMINDPAVAHNRFQFVPEWVVNDNGRLRRTEEWLQFGGSADEEYFMFDVLHIDQPLDEEINNVGMEDDTSLGEIDFSIIRSLPEVNLFNHDFMPMTTHLVFDADYSGYGEDVECEISLVGYLDTERQIVLLKKENITAQSTANGSD